MAVDPLFDPLTHDELYAPQDDSPPEGWAEEVASKEPPPETPRARTNGNGRKDEEVPTRTVKLTRASDITPRPVRWLWRDRLALGALSLLGGREGIGKSMVAYDRAAAITRGELPGVYRGAPSSVIVAATEDSWEHTIVPRLMAADADLDRVFRVDVTSSDDVDTTLTLPRDIDALAVHIRQQNVALVLLDPLISRLDPHLDTHKDAEVRRALEPMCKLADDTGVGICGLIHVNKSVGNDALSSLMASRAFPAVARSVLYVVVHPEDDNIRLLGQPKNNLGRTDLPTLTFTVESHKVADHEDGPVITGRLVWQGDTTTTIDEALVAQAESAESRTATSEAADWLGDVLSAERVKASADIRTEARKAGHSYDAVKRARRKVGAGSLSHGFPRRTFWSAPGMTPEEVQRWVEDHAVSEEVHREE